MDIGFHESEDLIHQQGQYKQQLNYYFQKNVISEQPKYTEEKEDDMFIATVHVILATTSEVIEGKGHPERSKADARESAAQDVCSKIDATTTQAKGMLSQGERDPNS